MAQTISFVGLGNMGRPMALNLISSGYSVTVYDKDRERSSIFEKLNANVVYELKDVVKPGCILITMVSDDEALLDVISRVEHYLGAENIHIAMSTVSPETIEKIDKIHKIRNTGFLSSPVLGRPVAIENKEAALFLSGNKVLKDKITPIIKCFGEEIFDFGESLKSASIAKLAMNFLILSAIESMGEAFSFVEKSALNSSIFSNMVTQTIFSCAGYKYHAKNIVERNFTPAGFRLDLGMKDISLLIREAKKGNIDMPVAYLLEKRLNSCAKKNRDKLDWSAISLESLE